jgi:hypothetical protein
MNHSRCFECMPAAAMPRLFLNFLFPLPWLQDGRFSVLHRFWMDSLFIYESGIKFLSFFPGRIFNVFIRIHSSNMLPFRRLRALIFSVFRGRIQTSNYTVPTVGSIKARPETRWPAPCFSIVTARSGTAPSKTSASGPPASILRSPPSYSGTPFITAARR